MIVVPTTDIVVKSISDNCLEVEIDNKNKENVSYKVVSLNGMILETKEVGDAMKIIETIKIGSSPGVYLLQVRVGDSVSTIKMISK